MHSMYRENELEVGEQEEIAICYLERIITNSVDNLLCAIPVK